MRVPLLRRAVYLLLAAVLRPALPADLPPEMAERGGAASAARALRVVLQDSWKPETQTIRIATADRLHGSGMDLQSVR